MNIITHHLVVLICTLLHIVTSQLQVSEISETCISCICEATSDCNRALTCKNGVCGAFSITKPYWIDARTPLIGEDTPDTPGAFERCVTEPECAAKTVKGYTKRYATDCNGDGVINCKDYLLIHHLGGFSCKTGKPDEYFMQNYEKCASEIEKITGEPL